RDDGQYSNTRDFSVPRLFDDARALLELLPVALECSRSASDRALQIRSGRALYFFRQLKVQLRRRSVFLLQAEQHPRCRAGPGQVPLALPEAGHDARQYSLIALRDQWAEDSMPARSEESRVGKEGRIGWWPERCRKEQRKGRRS